jgi:hypothetical protein
MTTLTSKCIVEKSHYIHIATLWIGNISYTSDIVVAPIWKDSIKWLSNDSAENAWFLSSLIYLPGNGPWGSPEGGCCAPFSCSWGIEVGPTGPCPGAHHTIQPGWPPSSGTWEHSCSPRGTLWVHTINLAHGAEQKLHCCWKVAERCQLRRRTATVWLLSDVIF